MNGNCPCDALDHPRVPSNPPALDTIAYRVGDYLSFREALLRARTGETQLTVWNPGASGDLAVQMIEWWAYVADVLTFYNERWINESFLRTAQLPESVTRLIAVLGYRPQPGIGATGTLGALLSATRPIDVPAGLRVQSKPGPGKQPQLFEVDAKTTVTLPDARDVDVAPSGALSDDGASVVLQGKLTTIAVGDELLLFARDGSQEQFGAVRRVELETDARGAAFTRVWFDAVPTGVNAADYRLLRSTRTTLLWPYPTTTRVIGIAGAVLASVVRELTPETPIVVRSSGFGGPTLATKVRTQTEFVWYANPTNPPGDAGSPPAANAVAIPTTAISWYYSLPWTPDPDTTRATFTVLHAWTDVGVLTSESGTALGARTHFRLTKKPPLPPALDGARVLIEAAGGSGAAATIALAPDQLGFTADFDDAAAVASLQPPYRALFDLLPVSRGQTVAAETLGSGDARVAGQEFVLQKSPLTYLAGPAPRSTLPYHSTLRVWVGGIEWTEVQSFFEQLASAHVFVTREDEAAKTHVLFGDGVNGARLPSGTGNVTASYRYGSGGDAPDAGTLAVVAQPLPGLRGVRNPVAVGGGSDPDAPAKIKAYAPQSVLTFGRAISADDYETIAAQAGVTRAKALWRFDATQQRGTMTVYVGDTPAAVGAVQAALASAIDPNRPPTIIPAVPVAVQLSLTVVVDPTYQQPPVVAAVRTALTADDAGLFGKSRLGIGANVFESEIARACTDVPGALAIEDVAFGIDWLGDGQFTLDAGPAHVAGDGNVFTLADADLTVASEALTDES
jgi:predicted phage baseplate assembly protein